LLTLTPHTASPSSLSHTFASTVCESPTPANMDSSCDILFGSRSKCVLPDTHLVSSVPSCCKWVSQLLSEHGPGPVLPSWSQDLRPKPCAMHPKTTPTSCIYLLALRFGKQSNMSSKRCCTQIGEGAAQAWGHNTLHTLGLLQTKPCMHVYTRFIQRFGCSSCKPYDTLARDGASHGA
jgi:hypothetical protein